MEKFKNRIRIQKERSAFQGPATAVVKGDDYLSHFSRERRHFLNDSRRLMPNGNSSAHMPCSAESRT